jgi:pSer/pThr/pTyr-binding forkhead associated (FHA) protein
MVDTAAPGKSAQTVEKSQGSSNRLVAKVASGSELARGMVQFSGKLILRNSDVALLLPPDQQDVVIGRTDPVQNIYPDVDLAEQDGEKNGVSRRHARILQRADGVYIEDLNSTNFTFLNHIRLVPGQVYPLKDGDELRLGVLTLDYRS